jgi:hypothetical protein
VCFKEIGICFTNSDNAIAQQYVNYSNITLKAGGPNGGDDEIPLELENGEIETRINLAILRVPECGQCSNCTDKSQPRKLCGNRLEARTRLVDAETKSVYAENKGKKGKKRKPEKTTQFPNPKKMKLAPGPKKKVPKMMKNANGQLKPRVTSQGNKRMAIPEEVFPEFCRRIGAKGTGERMKLINQFAEEHPTVSVRQVTLKLGEITTKDLPGCVNAPEKKSGRAFMFYLRPRFYKYLPAEDRPQGWEKYAEIDENKHKERQANKKSTAGEMADSVAESMTSDKLETASNVSPSSVADDDGEETEDEGEPVSKKIKMEN